MSAAVSAQQANMEERSSWIPMIAIAFGQAIMSFHVASLPVALGGMVNTFGVAPTVVAYRHRRLFHDRCRLCDARRKNSCSASARSGYSRLAVIVFGLSQILMTFSPNATAMITAQALCGAAGAVIVPAACGTHRRKLPRQPAGYGARRAQFGARGRRRSGIPYRRRP